MSDPISQFIPEDAIREIRDTCSIVEIISNYVSLKKIGINHKGLCPFHNEKTPSFFVNEERKFFHCFGCGASGDVFTFLMKHDNLSFQEAARQLAQKTGVALPEKPLSPQERKKRSEREELFAINKRAAKLFNHYLLRDKQGARARQYLEGRGISQETMEQFLLGFAPDSWNTLVNQCKAKNIPLEHAKKTGLIIGKPNGQHYDRFRNRIMFPIMNVSRQIIGFGGRIIDSGEPKYLNSPESVIYSKRHTLYGLQAATGGMSKESSAIIVEGYLDAITLHQAGITNTVAALGTALTEQQVMLLKRYTSDIITVFDADPSGEKAMVRSIEPFLKSGTTARLVLLPNEEDPDSFVKNHGADAFREKVRNAGLLLDYVIEHIIQKHGISTPRGKVTAVDEIVPLLKKIPDAMERDLYIQQIARRVGVKEAHIQQRMGNKQATAADPLEESAIESPSEKLENAEKIILKLMIKHPDIIEIVERDALIEEFSDTAKKIGALLSRLYKEQGNLNLAEAVENITEKNVKKILAELTFQDDVPDDPVKGLEDCVRDIRLKRNSKQLEKAKLLMKQAEASKDDSLLSKHSQEHQNLLKEKTRIQQYKLNLHHI